MSYTTIPFVIAYANELVQDPIGFELHEGRLRLAYRPSREDDWIGSVLRARVLDLRPQPAIRGPERMKTLNTLRQWQCMDNLWCQVCGGLAIDPGTGLVPWLLTRTVVEWTGLDSARTNAPPTCHACIDVARKECPMLQESATVYTVAAAAPAGVLADVYRPGPGREPIPAGHNLFIPWTAQEHHRGALATSQVVQLHGMRAVPDLSASP